jgi:hypothetical protein
MASSGGGALWWSWEAGGGRVSDQIWASEPILIRDRSRVVLPSALRPFHQGVDLRRGGLLVLRIKAEVLGFLSRHVEDLLDLAEVSSSEKLYR